MHVGHRIKEVMHQKNISVISVAQKLSCERTNIYNMFEREDINTNLLRRLCIVLNHDFFRELSKDISGKKQ